MKTTSLIGSTSSEDKDKIGNKHSVTADIARSGTPRTLGDDEAFFPVDKSPHSSRRKSSPLIQKGRNSPQVPVRGNNSQNQQWSANVETTTDGPLPRTQTSPHGNEKNTALNNNR